MIWGVYPCTLNTRRIARTYTKDVKTINVPRLFGPKWHSLRSCYFRAQKSLDFRPPPPKMPLVMDCPPSKPLLTAPYKQQVHSIRCKIPYLLTIMFIHNHFYMFTGPMVDGAVPPYSLVLIRPHITQVNKLSSFVNCLPGFSLICCTDFVRSIDRYRPARLDLLECGTIGQALKNEINHCRF